MYIYIIFPNMPGSISCTPPQTLGHLLLSPVYRWGSGVWGGSTAGPRAPGRK